MHGQTELVGERVPLAAIFRARTAEHFIDAADVLVDAGFQLLEFTLTTSGVLAAIELARRRYPTAVAIGAGTVRSPEHVDAAADAGADFLVSQILDLPSLRRARERGLSLLPGALTPNEIVSARNAGAEIVKVSPIGPVGGLGYFDELIGPLPEVPLFPTGGVRCADAGAYLDRGAALVGLSRDLLADALTAPERLGALADRAQRVIASISPLPAIPTERH